MKNFGEFPELLTELTEVTCKAKQPQGANDWMYEAKNIQANVSTVPAMSVQADALRQVGENTRQYIRIGKQWRTTTYFTGTQLRSNSSSRETETLFLTRDTLCVMYRG